MRVLGLIIGAVLLSITVGPLAWWLATTPDLERNGAFTSGVITALNDSTTREALARSLVYSLIAPTLQVVIAILIALPTSKMQRPSLFTILLLTPLSLSGLVASLCWKAMFVPEAGPLAMIFRFIFGSEVSFLSGRSLFLKVLPIYYGDLALFLLDTWIWVPIMTAFFSICLRRIPSHLLESATIEGASILYRAIRIEIPYIASYIAMTLIIRWADAFRLFDGPWTLFGNSPVISYFSTRVFSLTVISRDANAALSLSLAGLIITIPAFIVGSKVIRGLIERILHDD